MKSGSIPEKGEVRLKDMYKIQYPEVKITHCPRRERG